MTPTIEQLEEMLARATARVWEGPEVLNTSRAVARHELVDLLPALIAKIRALEAENKAMREALARADKFVTDFFAPWGSWKTVWWEGEVSDDVAFSDSNALKHVANIVSAAFKEQ